MKAVIVAHGAASETDRRALADADLVIAADGGARLLERWAVVPHIVVGDFDSLDTATVSALEGRGVRIERHPRAKDETDLELALAVAQREGATACDIIGSFGGERLDLTAANALLLASARWRGMELRAMSGGLTVRPLHAGSRLELSGVVGDRVSLLPIGEAGGVVTVGLRWALSGETLSSDHGRGLANEIVAAPASVSCSTGRLVVFELPGAVSGG